MSKPEHEHAKFLAGLEASEYGVHVVAHWLRRKGQHIAIAPMRKAPTRSDAVNYADQGDLLLLERLEVKHLSYSFTCADDWPHKNRFIVCAKHAWDNAFPKPRTYFYLNREATHVAILSAGTHKQWTVDRVRDRRFDSNNQECYFCPLSLVRFMSLD